MKSYRITKYNPIYRCSDGAYQNNEWTSVADVGKVFDGIVFNFEAYKLYEDAYIDTIRMVLYANNVDSIEIATLEKKHIIDCPDITKKMAAEYIKNLKAGTHIKSQNIDFLVRLMLREIIWCKLICASVFIHVGYDYYMYIGSTKDLENNCNDIKRLGLFIEEMTSPYL